MTLGICALHLGTEKKIRYNNTHPPKIQKCEKGKPERGVLVTGSEERAGGSDERATVRQKNKGKGGGVNGDRSTFTCPATML